MSPTTESQGAAKRPGSRHGPRKMVAFDPVLYAQLRILAEREDRALSKQAALIIRQALERLGLWPPPQQPREG